MLTTKRLENSVDRLKNDGVVILQDQLLNEAQANLIVTQLEPYFRRLNFGDVTGSSLVGSCQYIEFPLAVSLELTECVLNDSLIDLVSRYFNDEVRLTSCRVQRRLCGGTLEPHRDYGDGIVVIHYLTKPKRNQGATSFYLGSHTSPCIGRESGIEDAVYVREINELNRFSRISMAGRKIGSVAIYSSKTIHEVPKFSDPGRIVILSSYTRLCDARSFYYRHILTSDCLNLIPANLQKVIGLGDPQLNSSEIMVKPFQFTLSYDSTYRYSFARRCFWLLRFFRLKVRALLARAMVKFWCVRDM